ncbi:MAG: HXXEE domain-containing protein [Brevundimonas sp.]
MVPGRVQDGAGRRRTAATLLFLAMLLHNLEEGVTYAATRSEATRLVQGIWPTAQLPTPVVFQAALLALTAAVGVTLAWAATTRRDRDAWFILKLIASLLLVNVMVPHVPAAILLGGYAPGVMTAVLINLPVSLWILAQRPPDRARA